MKYHETHKGQFWFALLLVVGVMLHLNSAQAAPAAGAPDTANAAPSAQRKVAPDADDVAPDSPRASLETYLQLCSRGDYKQAARFLNVPPSGTTRAPELARRLYIVLQRRVSFDFDAISPKAFSSSSHPSGYEEVGRISEISGRGETLKLIRKGAAGDDGYWAFSQSVVLRVDGWYSQLKDHWFLDHLPDYLLRQGPLDLMVWQWLAIPILLLLAWSISYVLSRISRKILALVAARTSPTWDDELVANLHGPLTLTWMLILTSWALPWLGLGVSADQFGWGLVRGGFFFTGFWVLSRLVEAWGKRLISSQWAQERSVSGALINLGVRVGKIAVLVLAVLALISALGYPAGSLLAGLGVGGLAVALGAQKTLENLFGAFSIGVDQPFHEGDFVKVDDVLGNVESIGLRSTRIRTLDRTLVTIPNGRLSEMRVESYSARDRIRLACSLGLVYGTTGDQMRRVVAGLENILNSHPKIVPNATVVRFSGFNDSWLTVDVMAWFLTADWNEFQSIRQEIYIQFMDCVRMAGTTFAYPTQTLQLEKPID